MKTGILIFLCCIAATYCYSIADFADSLADKIIAKREAERIFDEEEYVPLENGFDGDDINAGRPEETGNPGEIAEPLVDFTEDEEVQQEVGNPIEAQPFHDLAVANEETVNSLIISDTETKKEGKMKILALVALLALEPKSYQSDVAKIVTKKILANIIMDMKNYGATMIELRVIYGHLREENGQKNKDIMKELMSKVFRPLLTGVNGNTNKEGKVRILENALVALEPKSYQSVVAKIVTKKILANIIMNMENYGNTMKELRVIYVQLREEIGQENKDVMNELLYKVLKPYFNGED